jgi:hypothetical protein
MRSGIVRSFLFGIVVSLAFASVASADSPRGTVYNLSPADDWFSVIGCDGCAKGDLLQPGDEVILQPGIYSDPRRINIFARGTAEHPITIRAADPNNKPVFQRPFDPTRSRNHVLNLEGSQYLTLDGLEITGGAWGIRIGSTLRPANPAFFPSGIDDRGPLPPAQAKFITLQNLYVHDTGANAITANMSGDIYEGIIIRNNELSHTGIFGEGLYLGCNNDACQFFDGLIENNYIHDLNGPITDQGDGIEIKHGSYNNVVRNNVIHDTRYPGIIAYGTAGNGAPNVFEGNVIWGSETETMQIAADAIVRNNILFPGGGATFRSQNHQGATPGNLTIVNNTIISTNQEAIRVANTVTHPIVIANNAIYSRTNRAIRLPSLNRVTLDRNVGSGSVSPSIPTTGFDASGNITTDFVDLDWNGPSRDVYPAVLSALIDAGNPTFQPFDDFNGTLRAGNMDVGAYVFDSDGNPGWTVTSGFKPGPDCDFNGDNGCNLDDVNLLLAALGTDNDALDMNGSSGLIDQDDVDVWLTSAGNGSIGRPFVRGDTNLDGRVDASDLNNLATHWQLTGADANGWGEGDFNGDGNVSASDLNEIGRNWRTGVGVASAVPEPSGFALLMGTLLLGVLRPIPSTFSFCRLSRTR